MFCPTLRYSYLLQPALLYPTLCPALTYTTRPCSTQLYSTPLNPALTIPIFALLYPNLPSFAVPYPTLRYSTLLYPTLPNSSLLYRTLRYLAQSIPSYSNLPYSAILYPTRHVSVELYLLYSTTFTLLCSTLLLHRVP